MVVAITNLLEEVADEIIKINKHRFISCYPAATCSAGCQVLFYQWGCGQKKTINLLQNTETNYI